MLRDMLLVALGGAVGAASRYGVSLALARDGFPWATLTVNLVGALALGLLLGASDGRTHLFLAVGVLGSFTTLSTFGFETFALVQNGRVAAAGLNVLANGIGGPLLAALGFLLTRLR